MFKQQQQKRNKTNPIFVYNSITTLFRFSGYENTAIFFACLFLHSYCFLTMFMGKAFAQLPKNIENFLKEVLYRLALSYLLCGVGGFLRNQISDKTL